MMSDGSTAAGRLRGDDPPFPCTVLLVEPDRAMAAATSAVLEAAGCTVLPAASLRTAIRLLDVIQAQVILADPGPRFLRVQPSVWRRLLQRAGGVAVILFTGDPVSPEQAREAGFTALLAKP